MTFYSDGTYTYGRVRKDKGLFDDASERVPRSSTPVGDSLKHKMAIRGNFALKIADGDLSIFEENTRFSTYSTNDGRSVYASGISRRKDAYYVQKSGTNELKRMNVSQMAKYIMPGTPGYSSLSRSRGIKAPRVVGRAACFALIVLASRINTTDKFDPSTVMAGTTACAGFFGCFYFSSYKAYERNALFRAVERHNAEMKK